ncbi:MAG: hypothetical protein WBF89_19260, partial [Steroidobacteraceae bacterium]
SVAAGAWSRTAPEPLILGAAAAALDGPWRFHTGDDARWSDPGLDDSDWESVDLSASRSAHDPDVGLTRYVPGWQTKGHHGYFGYAWYRIRVPVQAASGIALALCGPFYVDSAYQLFTDGRLQGEAGNFAGSTPAAGNNHLPRRFALPPARGDGMISIAVRVWMPPFMLADPQAGGMHIAPILGTDEGAAACYQSEWREMIDGYAVDAAEALIFVLLALMVCALMPLDRRKSAYLWMAGALVALAIARGNQAVFFWWDFESVHGFEVVTAVLAVPLCLGAWTLAWARWFRLEDRVLAFRVVAPLTVFVMLAQCLRRSWFYGDFPPGFSHFVLICMRTGRWLFALLALLIVFRVAVRAGRERWWSLPPLMLLAVGLHATELVSLHLPGIWFPFGVGVSLSEYAYAGFDVALLGLLLHRLYSLKQPPRPPVTKVTPP